MSGPVIYLGAQPRTPCQKCGLFERDAYDKCYCPIVSCPVGLLHRRMRQRTWPTGQSSAGAKRAEG